MKTPACLISIETNNRLIAVADPCDALRNLGRCSFDLNGKLLNPHHQQILLHLNASADVKRLAAEQCATDILQAADLLSRSLSAGGTLLLCGNGGSAADCQHMAAEFVSRLTMDFVRPAIAAVALTTDTSFLTAYTNDVDFDGVFARQVEALGRRGDVLLGISTSGGSRNVVRAAEAARRKGMSIVVLMGESGALEEAADVAIKVPSRVTQHVQETHLAIEHVICHLVERQMYGSTSADARQTG